MARLTRFFVAFMLPLSAWCQPGGSPPASDDKEAADAAASGPVNAIWAGEWKPVEFNLPPTNMTLTTRRAAGSLQVKALIAAVQCPMTYDGVLPAADIARRIEERALWQLNAANWPSGTDPFQFVGLKKEFDQALRITRSLPADNYRRVRVTCLGQPQTDDRFYILNDGRRLFEFRFPDNGLSLSVTLYERLR